MTAPGPSFNGSLCFIVDDDEDTRLNLHDILELEGYRVQQAATAREMLALPNWDELAVVLLDRRLPDGSPLELLPAIRNRAPNVGVIIVTGYSDIESAVSCLRAGARDYIVKPVNSLALLASVSRELERQRTAESLARSEQRHRALFEHAMDGFLILDRQWRIVEANPAACVTLGFESDEILDKPLRQIVHDLQNLKLPAAIEKQVRLADEWQLLRKDGIPIDVEYRLVTNFSPGLHLVSLQNVTDRKMAERRARQAERLAAIGETMTGLVHESRNALQRSSACLEMLELELADRPGELDLVRRTQRAQEQLRQLYEDVRQWAAPVNLHRQDCNVADVWREAWQYVTQVHRAARPQLQEDIQCSPKCNIDRSIVQQVFRNIFENAIEASPTSGSIFLHCSNGDDSGQSSLRIVIRDEGPGLTPEQQARIFEPFFTTKAKGTGLGMALCQRIINAHDGTIAASSPGGAQIELTLPKGSP